MQQNFTVNGMTCGHCEKAVHNAILAVDPAARVHIDRAQNSVVVDSTAPPATLVTAIQEEGYTVVV